MKRSIRIVTRGSRLARWQTDHVAERIAQLDPALTVEIHEVTTTGDVVRDRALSAIGQTGVFTKELERLLLDGEADIAVHSLKDMETTLPDGLELLALPVREEPRDALVCREATGLDALPRGSCVGTSSIRRRAQLLALRDDLRFVDLRGNVPTRLEKLTQGADGMDAIVLATAGLRRLGFAERITEILDTERVMSAVGQGIVAIEGRLDDAELGELLRPLDDPRVRAAAVAERAWLRCLQGGCQVPAGALATIDGDTLRLTGVVCALDGRTVIRDRDAAPPASAASLGERLAAMQLAQGADRLVAEVEELLRQEVERDQEQEHRRDAR